MNPSDDTLRELLTTARTIAIVGASSRPDRPSNGVMRFLLGEGYEVIPVNPNETKVVGRQVYPSLADLPRPVDIVNVFRRSGFTPPIAQDAVRIGATAFWLQLGIRNEDAAARAAAGGLIVVQDLCISIVIRELRIPSRHRLAGGQR
jgi:predicted CoA-binding protein